MNALIPLQLLNAGLRPHILLPNSKRPASRGWQKEADWSAEAVRARFEAAPEGSNTGVLAGAGLVVVDVDGDEGRASLARLEGELGALPTTVRASTPRGGEHVYLKAPNDVRLGNSASRLGRGIDIRADGGQVACPPSSIDGRSYSWRDGCSPFEMPVAEMPSQWLARLMAPASPALPPGEREVLQPTSDREHAKRRARAYLAKVPGAVSGQGGHNQTFYAACQAVELCQDADDVREVMAEYNTRCEPPWSADELEHKVSEALRFRTLGERLGADQAADESAAGLLLWVEELQAYVARSADGKTWNIGNPLTDRAAAMSLHGAGLDMDAARAVLRRGAVGFAKRIDVDPGQPSSYRDQHGSLVVNNYARSTIVPSPGNFPIIDEMMTVLTGGNNVAAKRWLTNWFAMALQFPAKRLKTSPVVYGTQGSGKSPLLAIFSALMGSANCGTIRDQDIHGRFNAHYAQKLLVVVEEIRAAEVEAATATLKYLTGAPTLQIEAKGASPFEVRNRLKVVCLSNNTLPVKVEANDTRWVMFRNFAPVPPDYTARMRSLFDEEEGSLSEKGLAEAAAWAHYLLSWTVDITAAHTPPETGERAEAMEASRGSVEQFVDSVDASSLDAVFTGCVPVYRHGEEVFRRQLDVPGQPTLVGAEALYAVYSAFSKASGLSALGAGRFWGELARFRPSWAPRRRAVGEDGRVHDERPRGARFNCYEGLPRNRSARLGFAKGGEGGGVAEETGVVVSGPGSGHPNVRETARLFARAA